MTDPLRPEEIDEAPSSEPSTIVTASAPVLPGDPMGIDGGRAMPSPLGPPSVARSPHAPEASSQDVTQPKKQRPKMTLRIPDDEVARPSRPVPSSVSSRPVSVPPPQSGQIKGDRIFNLSIDTPTSQIQVPSPGSSSRTPSPAPAAVAEASVRAPVAPARPHSVVPPATGEDTAPHRAFAAPVLRPPPKDEDSWTPYQPMAVDNEPAPDSASSVDIPIDMGSFDQELAASGDVTLASAEALPARALPAVAVGPLPPPLPPPMAPTPPLPSSRAPNVLPDPASPSRTVPHAAAVPPASAEPPQLTKTGPNPAAAPLLPPGPPPLSRTAPHPGAPPLPPHDPPALSRSGANASAAPPVPPEPAALAKSGALPAAPPPPPPTVSRSPPPPEVAPVVAAPAPLSTARAPASTSAPPASGPVSSPLGPDSFPEMVFDDNLFSTSQRTASDAPPREAIVPAEPQASTEAREPDEAPTAPRLPPSSDHAALAPHAPAPLAAVPPSRRSRQGATRGGEVIEELDIEHAIASEPAEAAELSPEDFVSVEAVPQPRASSPSAPPPPMRPRAASAPSFNTVPPVPPAVSKPRMSTPSVPTATVKIS